MLIARGVSVAAKTMDGDTFVHYVALLNMTGAVNTRGACFFNIFPTASVDLVARNRLGETPLDIACSRGKADVSVA